MDLLQHVWDQLRADGHALGTSHFNEQGKQFAVVDGVAMTLPEAKAVAEKRVTVTEIAAAKAAKPA